MRTLSYRKDIDALRGVAVLFVVLYHAFPEAVPGGFTGVDIFFVISGFLITRIISEELNNGKFTFSNFYARRIRRIFPALFTVILTTCLLGWLFFFPDELKELGTHTERAALFILNFKLIDELGYFDIQSHFKPLLHLWTLSIEEQYYLFWPLLVYLIKKTRLDIRAILIILITVSFSANLAFVREYSDQVFYHSGSRFWELGLGALLAIYSLRYPNIIIQNGFTSKLLFILGIFLITISGFWINDKMLFPGFVSLIPTVGTAALLIAKYSLPKWGGLVQVGLLSYSLYLWHWVFISFLYIYLGNIPSFIERFASILLSFFLAYLTYTYVEKIRYKKSKIVIPALLLMALCTGVSGFIINVSNGFINRPHFKYFQEYLSQLKRPPAEDQTCANYVRNILQTNKLFLYCRATKNILNYDKPKIAVIGDSHAHTLFPGISKIASENQYETVLLANTSCPPLKGFQWGKNDKERKTCQQSIEQILSIVKQDSSVKTVILATRGPVYIHGEVNGEFTKESVQKNLDHFVDKIKFNYETFSDALRRSMIVLSEIDHIEKIFYVLENPELDFHPKKNLPRPFDYLQLSVSKSKVSQELYLTRMDNYQKVIASIASDFKKLDIIDLAPLLCDKSYCFSFKNNKLYYTDEDHISVYGSHFLARGIKKYIFP